MNFLPREYEETNEILKKLQKLKTDNFFDFLDFDIPASVDKAS